MFFTTTESVQLHSLGTSGFLAQCFFQLFLSTLYTVYTRYNSFLRRHRPNELSLDSVKSLGKIYCTLILSKNIHYCVNCFSIATVNCWDTNCIQIVFRWFLLTTSSSVLPSAMMVATLTDPSIAYPLARTQNE
jgi:hypothetical protein